MIVPGSANPLLLASAAAAGGLQVSRSLRFNASDSGYLSRVVGTAGNRRTFTLSWWIKKSGLTTFQSLFNSFTDANNRTAINFDSSIGAGGTGDYLTMFNVTSSTTTNIFQTNALFRDASAWYHIVVAVDTTQATSTERVKLWVNNTLQTFSTYNAPSQNADLNWNSATTHYYGVYGGSPSTTSYGFNGYLANIHFIDGQALTPASFAETDATTGQWIPKAFSGGSYGTNGFYLQFADNSSNTASTLGKDTSGNSPANNWTPNNFSVSTTTTTYTPASNTNLYGMTWAQIFDANNSAGVYSLDNTLATGTLAISKSYSSSVELLCCSTNSSAPIYANGVAVSSPPGGNNFSSAQWRTVLSGSGTLTSVGVQSDGAQRGILFQVRVDGVQLVNISAAGNDSLVDSPTNYGTDTGVGGEVRGNYATLNPLNAAHTYTNGNLDLTISTTGHASIGPAVGSIGVSSGKWYFEFTPTSITSNPLIGITAVPATDRYPGYSAFSYGYYASDGNKYNNNSASSYGNSWVANDVIGVAFDLDAGKLWFSKNGTWQASGNPSSGTNAAFTSITAGVYFPSTHKDSNGASTFSGVFNFGQRAFAYTAPSGFKALCTQNLPAPLVTKSNTVMDVVLYTGNNSTQSITSLAFNPDMVWSKCRNVGRSHRLSDAIRGSNVDLYTDTTASDNFYGSGSITAFTANGFNLDNSASSQYNTSGETYVSWCWDAGTSTTTINANAYSAGVPSITSQVRANASAGFSVVTYTGTGSTATVGHGLGVAPSLILCKSRTTTVQWVVYHASLGKDQFLGLNTTDAAITSSSYWGSGVTSTVFGLQNLAGGNNNGNLVAYCFAPVVGYSAMGSYQASSGLPFVYLGFKPKLLLIKNITSSSTSWRLMDSARDTFNDGSGAYWLKPNTSDAEVDERPIDFLSNGFKLRMTDGGDLNYSSDTYIYCAWAESPFNYSRAR